MNILPARNHGRHTEGRPIVPLQVSRPETRPIPEHLIAAAIRAEALAELRAINAPTIPVQMGARWS